MHVEDKTYSAWLTVMYRVRVHMGLLSQSHFEFESTAANNKVFPFLLWYISTKVMAMDRRGLNRRQCMLYILKSVGYAGTVLFMQVLSVYIVFQMVCLLIFPLIVFHHICLMLVVFSFLTTCTALNSLSSLHYMLPALLTTLLLHHSLHPGCLCFVVHSCLSCAKNFMQTHSAPFMTRATSSLSSSHLVSLHCWHTSSNVCSLITR